MKKLAFLSQKFCTMLLSFNFILTKVLNNYEVKELNARKFKRNL
ncbi:TPA: hypothetical protein ACH6H0_000848 [Campylobacter jejuni]